VCTWSLLIQLELTFENGRPISLQRAAGEFGVFCNSVPRPAGSIRVNRREHT
jgi:hypothetical protein